MNLAGKILKTVEAEEILHRLPEGRKKDWLRRQAIGLFAHPRATTLVNKGDTVLHAGVWRIETVENWVEAVGQNGHVIIVEADPQNAEILEIERKRRELENVTIINKAVWNEPGETELLVSPISCRNKLKNSETYLPERPNDSFQKNISVESDTIDNIIETADVGSVDLVYTHISGAEIEAIEGMEATLDKPSIRVWMRAIHIFEESDMSADKKVAQMLRNRGLNVKYARNEPDRHGGNVYASKH